MNITFSHGHFLLIKQIQVSCILSYKLEIIAPSSSLPIEMNNVSSTYVAQGTQLKRIWKFAKKGVVKGMEAIKLKSFYMIFYHHSRHALALICLYLRGVYPSLFFKTLRFRQFKQLAYQKELLMDFSLLID